VLLCVNTTDPTFNTAIIKTTTPSNYLKSKQSIESTKLNNTSIIRSSIYHCSLFSVQNPFLIYLMAVLKVDRQQIYPRAASFILKTLITVYSSLQPVPM
jgi:hypothetical protein